jgi:signal transduction histidine kinase
LPPEIEAAMYYCCTEALQNASKHAGPDAHISIRLYSKGDQLHLEVRDDGPGFDATAAHDGIGLQNMRDRLGAVRGSVEIISQPGHGTRIAATAPVRATPERAAAPEASAGSQLNPRRAAGGREPSIARAESTVASPPYA